MYIKYRLSEAGHEPYVSAPTTRPIKLVVHDFEADFDTYVEKPGRSCPVDVAFADVEPSEYAAIVIPGGRAPEFIRVDPDVRRIVEHFFAEEKPVGTLCHGPQVPAALGLLRGRPLVGLPAARPGHPSRRAPSTSTAQRSSTGTWCRAGAGATLPTGRGRSSSARPRGRSRLAAHKTLTASSRDRQTRLVASCADEANEPSGGQRMRSSRCGGLRRRLSSRASRSESRWAGRASLRSASSEGTPSAPRS